MRSLVHILGRSRTPGRNCGVFDDLAPIGKVNESSVGSGWFGPARTDLHRVSTPRGGGDRWTSHRIMSPYKGRPRVVSLAVVPLDVAVEHASALPSMVRSHDDGWTVVPDVGIGTANRPTRERE